jgi:hypothetical protein
VIAQPAERLDRRLVVRELLAGRDRLVVVTGLGSSSYDTMAAGDHDLNYYLWGAMGSAAPVGLGLAIAQPRRPVLVITGDGELLMGLGSLATIGVQRPPNLTIAVLDTSATPRPECSTATPLRACGSTRWARPAALPGRRRSARPRASPTCMRA